jgi:HAD superfamily phosphoserine phosphatase-like hydrolase
MNTAICLDLDGTITREEILPKIAKHLKIHEEIETLTQATIKGLIPFESSFKLRVRLLKDFPITSVQESLKSLVLYEGICALIKNFPENFFIVTGNLDVWVSDVIARIGAQSFTSIAEIQSGEVTGITKILNKGEAVKTLRNKFQKIIAVGEGMNDVPMFEAADIAIAYGATHQPVKTALELCDLAIYDEETLCRLLRTLL